jgi:hypothetical protein
MSKRRKKKNKRRKFQTEELAAHLAPLEETQETLAKAGEQKGVILVGSKENKKMPASLSEEDGKGVWRIDNAMIIVLLIALVYISFIAYLIWQMPEQK